MGELGFIFRMIDRFSSPGNAAIRLFKQIDSLMSRTQRGAGNFGRALGTVFSTATTRARGFLATMSTIRRKIFNLPNLIAGSAIGYGAGKLFSAGINAASFKESTLASFSTLLGSQEAAQKTLDQAIQFAAKTPFSTDQVIGGFQTLLTARFDPKDIIPILSGVGDLAALRGFDPNVIDRVLMAISQVKNKGKFLAEEMQQMAEAGVPVGKVYDVLADKLNMTTDQVRKLQEAGKISPDLGIFAVMEALRQTVSGGALGGQMAKQSQNLTGLWSTLKSRPLELLMDLDTSQGFKDVKAFISNLVDLTDTTTTLGQRFKKVVLSSFGRVLESVFGPLKRMTSASNIVNFFAQIERVGTRMSNWWTSTMPGLIRDVKAFGQGFWEGFQTVRDILGPLIGLMDGFSTSQWGMSESSAHLIGKIVAFGGALWLANAASLGLVGVVARSLIPALAKLGWSVLVAIGPWGWLAAAVIAAGLAIWLNWDWVTKQLQTAWTAISTGATAAWDSVIAKGTEMLTFIQGLPGQVLTSATQLGANMINGIVQGYENARTALGDAANWIVDKTIGQFQRDAEMHSPSRVMMWAGEMLGVGLAQGIKSTSSMVDSAMSDLTPVTTAAPVAGPSARGGGTSFGGVTVNIQMPDNVKNVEDFVGELERRFPALFISTLERLASETA